jgi:hypothetical protein
MSKLVGTGPSSYEKRIYRAAVSQRLTNAALHHTSNTANSLGCTTFIRNTFEYDDQVYLTKWKIKLSTIPSATCICRRIQRTLQPMPTGYARIPTENAYFFDYTF